MSSSKQFLDSFAYHVEDLNCSVCLHRIKKSERKNKNLGCGEDICRYTGILVTAIENGNFKRKHGYFKVWDENPGSR